MPDHDDNRAEWRKHAPNDPYNGGCVLLLIMFMCATLSLIALLSKGLLA